MASSTLLLPGTPIPASELPSNPSRPLVLGPGLRSSTDSGISTTTIGVLTTSTRKNAAWLSLPPSLADGGSYTPSTGDLVVAQIHHSSAESYAVVLSPFGPLGSLGQLAFEGASRKTRPMLKSGDLVYGRISKARRGGETEVECFDPSTGKAGGLGSLTGGTVVGVSLGVAGEMLSGKGRGQKAFEVLGEKVGFEMAVGRNGRVWVKADGVRETMVVSRVVKGLEGVKDGEEKRFVDRVIKDVLG